MVMKEFRLAAEIELQDILALYQSVKGEEYCPWSDEYPTWREVIHDYATHNLYVCSEGGRVIGAVSVLDTNEYDELSCWHCPRGRAREIARLVVSPACRGQGIGGMMVSRIEEIMRMAGVSAVHLLAAADNVPACRTYEKGGYEFVGECDLYGIHFYACEKMLEPTVTNV